MSDLSRIICILMLLGVANAAPILARKLLGQRGSAPIDLGWHLPDGHPLFGAAKTYRGLAASLFATALAGLALGIGAGRGLGLAAASMLGDLASSFAKRRLRLAVHAQAFGIDQIPEALVPLLLLRTTLQLRWIDIVMLTVSFVVAEIVLSRVFFWLRIRDRPY